MLREILRPLENTAMSSKIPLVSIITPTIGRATLARAAESLLPQLGSGDEWHIVGDGPQPRVRCEVAEWKHAGVRYSEVSDRLSAYGNAQRNHAMRAARGDVFVFLDDDDELTPGAVETIRQAARLERPMMFRMDYRPGRCLLWRRPELKLGNVGGAMFVVPRLAGRWCEWPTTDDSVASDFAFIRSTLALWPAEALLWRDEVICLCRGHGAGR